MEMAMHVLVVDKDESALDHISDLLTASGHAVSRAINGHEAIQLLENSSFSLVITEWNLPGIDGRRFCRLIRSHRTAGYLYVIVLTEDREEESSLCALEAGADHCMCKPFRPEELLLRVNTAKRVASAGVREVALFAMAQLAESRDPHTGQHLERMRNYCWVMARWLRREYPEITDEFLDTIYQTSALHDIGKVAIPDRILLKPGGLNEDELEIMKRHTTIGAQTLMVASRQYPEVGYFVMAKDIALTHHEAFNGSGYPQGLRGYEIPLCGRIVALVDAYDALTSFRPYKDAFGHEASKNLILESSDRFDPRVLTGFLDLESEFIAIRDAFADEVGPSSTNVNSQEQAESIPV
jgi:putative two-component system response regulator